MKTPGVCVKGPAVLQVKKLSNQAVCSSTVASACEALHHNALIPAAENECPKQLNKDPKKKIFAFEKKEGRKLDKLYLAIPPGMLEVSIKSRSMSPVKAVQRIQQALP